MEGLPLYSISELPTYLTTYLTNQPTNSVVRIPSTKAKRCDVQQTPRILWNPEFHYPFRKDPPLILGENPIKTFQSHLSVKHYTVLLSIVINTIKFCTKF
jgi:hypothetical protein